MKIYISSDIEGTCGACDWDEALNKGNPGYLGTQMSKEVSAAANAALDSGADEVVVRDAHGSALNITSSLLPKNTKLIRGWAHDLYCMMTGIDKAKYDAVMFTGYHSSGGSTGNPLSHTMHRYVDSLKINGEYASEFMMNAYTAGYFDIPVCFISGDKTICNEAKEFIPDITAVPVTEGIGGSTLSLHPENAVENIYNGVLVALKDETYKKCKVDMPASFEVQVTYANHVSAFHNSFYPGARQISNKKVCYNATDYLDVLRFFHFCMD